MAFKAGNLIIGGKETNIEPSKGTIEVKTVQMEEGTVIHNGQPKKFNKKMSAYMIDMLTSEE